MGSRTGDLIMKHIRFSVVYDRAGHICEATFDADDRAVSCQDAASFADILEEQGIRFRVWNPEGGCVRQSLGRERVQS
jgi:hypothetical protein